MVPDFGPDRILGIARDCHSTIGQSTIAAFPSTPHRREPCRNFARIAVRLSLVLFAVAMIGSFGHVFYVLKSNSMFKLETMYLPEARMRGPEIANRIISHL